MLATKTLAGVTSQLNLRERVTHTPLPSVNKAAHCTFETGRKENRGIRGPAKRTCLFAWFGDL